MTARSLGIGAMVAAFVALAAAALPSSRTTVPVGADDIGGVVTGPNGPEAGVWVIAETNDLPTKFVRIVVTDDQGRYLIPDLPKANYSVWVRGYGLVDSPKSTSTHRRDARAQGRAGAERRAPPRRYYPAGYWYSLLAGAGQERVPGHRPGGQRHLAEHEDAGGLPAHDQVGHVHGVPPDRHQGDARDSRDVQVAADEHGAVGAARAVRPGRRGHARATSGGSATSARSRCSPTGRTASRRARCRRRRAGRRGSSATS